jgi:integrase
MADDCLRKRCAVCGQKIFGNSQLSQFRQNFMTQRKRASSKLQNPRLQKISFHILRHFYGTMLYHRTKDILYVKEKLGHRNINSTLIYTQLVCFDKDDYTSKTAKTTKEASQLVEAGFKYVCTTPESVMLFRKRK